MQLLMILVSVITFISASFVIDDPKAIVDTLITGGSGIQSGHSDDPKIGDFVVVIENLPDGDARAVEKARQQAMKRIGEFLGAKVETSTESSSKESTNSKGESTSSSYFHDFSAVRVNTVMGAVEMLAIRSQDKSRFAVFMLSEGASKRMQVLSEEATKAMKDKKSGPIEVVAVGIATIQDNNQEVAKNKATESAKRFAIEMAVGASVVGLTVADQDDNSSTFRDSVISSSDGQIATYTTLSEGAIDGCYRVEIKAVIEQDKLVEKYNAHLQAMGDPLFSVDAPGDVTLQQLSSEYFIGKGFRVKNGGDCQWQILIKPTFTKRADPQDPAKSGFQCLIKVELRNARTGQIFAGISESGRGFSSMNGDVELQKRKSAEIAFKNVGDELHKKINEAVLKLAREGRPVIVRITSELAREPRHISALQDSLALRLGMKNAKVSLKDGNVYVEVTAQIATDLVAKFVASDVCSLMPGSKSTITRQDGDEVDMKINVPSP